MISDTQKCFTVRTICFIVVAAYLISLCASSENEIDARSDAEIEYDDWKNSYLSWLTQKQKEDLDNLFENGASKEDLFLKVFEYFDFDMPKKDSSSRKAIEQLSNGCFRFMKEHSELNSEDFFDVAEEMFQSPFDEDLQKELISKANQLYATIKDVDKKIFAQKFIPSCVKIYMMNALSKVKVDSESDKKILASQINGFEENYHKWFETYLSWLTEEQKSYFNNLKLSNSANIEDYHSSVMEMYSETEGKTLAKANHDLNLACNRFIKYLAESSEFNHVEEFERIQNMASDIHTEAEGKVFAEKISQKLTDEISQLILNINDANKQTLASKFLGSCKKIILFNCHMIRSYNDNHKRELFVVKDADIEQWKNLYWNWLTDKQQIQFNTLKDEGASIEELQAVIEEMYAETEEDVFIKATESLSEGCSVLIKYLAGEENFINYMIFMENAVERYPMEHSMVFVQETEDTAQLDAYKETLAVGAFNHIISAINDTFKRTVAEKFIVSCSVVFDAVLRSMDTETRHEHDEI